MQETIRKAHELRRKNPNVPASVRLAWARQVEPEELDWNSHGDRAELDRDGFHVIIRVEPDDYNDLSYLGTFSDRWEEGAIQLAPHEGLRAIGPTQGDAYRYFVPAITEAETRAHLNKLGYSKGVAADMAREDVMRSLEALTTTTSSMVSVTAYKAGVDLGRAVLGGIDTSWDQSYEEARRYIEQTIDDMIGEAIDEARETLESLCAEHRATPSEGSPRLSAEPCREQSA